MVNRARDRQPRAIYVCQECGHESARWMGFCPSPACRPSLPLVEMSAPSSAGTGQTPYGAWLSPTEEPLQELASLDPKDQPRIPLPNQELNRALGGGLVPGSVVLLAGEPGVGKSTLLLQIAQDVAAQGQTVIYVSGEESPHQIKLRADRLGFTGKGIYLLGETDVDRALARLEEVKPALAIIDSIQTLYTADAPSSPGSVVQVRECGLRLMRWAKLRHTPVLLAGHVTKDGTLAGPRVLEHMVDVVTYLEAQNLTAYRILRNSKNRFGSTTEVGIFEMTGAGLQEASDPSQALLSQRHEHAVGAALAPTLEGSRPLLLEVQALTSSSFLPVPRRVANGVDHNRLTMLTAVGSRRAGLELGGQDIIVSVAGGFQVDEPAADLAIALAMASSLHNRPLDSGLVALGEIGLSGELRAVPQASRRLSEAARLGLTCCVLPEACRAELGKAPLGIQVIYAKTLRQALLATLGSPGAAEPQDK